MKNPKYIFEILGPMRTSNNLVEATPIMLTIEELDITNVASARALMKDNKFNEHNIVPKWQPMNNIAQ